MSMLGYDQRELFEAGLEDVPIDPVAERIELMRGFIDAELAGLNIDGETSTLTLVDVLAIAAEGMAQVMAKAKGLDPGAQSFLSENIISRLNQETASQAFLFDVDHAPGVGGVSHSTSLTVQTVFNKSLAIANQLVNEVRVSSLGAKVPSFTIRATLENVYYGSIDEDPITDLDSSSLEEHLRPYGSDGWFFALARSPYLNWADEDNIGGQHG